MQAQQSLAGKLLLKGNTGFCVNQLLLGFSLLYVLFSVSGWGALTSPLCGPLSHLHFWAFSAVANSHIKVLTSIFPAFNPMWSFVPSPVVRLARSTWSLLFGRLRLTPFAQVSPCLLLGRTHRYVLSLPCSAIFSGSPSGPPFYFSVWSSPYQGNHYFPSA